MWNATTSQDMERVTDDLYAVSDGVRILHATAIAILGATGAIGNFLVILSIATTPDLRTSHNLCILNLSVADFLLSIISEPVYFVCVVFNRWPLTPVECRLAVKISILLMSVSITTLGTVALNRFILISKPNVYNKFCSRRNTIINTVLVWTLAITMVFVIAEYAARVVANYNTAFANCALDPLDHNTHVFMTIVIVLLIATPLLVLPALYYLMFRAIRASKRRVQVMQVAVSTPKVAAVSQGDSSGQGPVGKARLPERTISREEISMAKMSLFVTVLFVVCWLPLSITYVFGWRYPAIFRTGRFSFFLIVLGPALNPFIYAWMNTKMREACLRLVRCQRCPHRAV